MEVNATTASDRSLANAKSECLLPFENIDSSNEDFVL